MVYAQIKELHETMNKAASDLSEMERQYAAAIRSGNNEAIVKLGQNVEKLRLAHELLCELIDDLG